MVGHTTHTHIPRAREKRGEKFIKKSEKKKKNQWIGFFFFVFQCCSFLLLLQDNKSFHNGRQGDVIFGGQFGSFAVSQKDGRRVRLEAGDGLGFAGLAHHVDGLSHPHRNGQRSQFFVEGDQHSWLQRSCQRVQQIMRLTQDDCKMELYNKKVN